MSSDRGESRELRDRLAKGVPLPSAAGRLLTRLLGTKVGRSGLCRFFQPSFPGVRTYIVEAQATPNRTLELTLVGMGRDGGPEWTARRAISRGPDDSLEIHHVSDETEAPLRSRNVLVDTIVRELTLLTELDAGANPRITVDAHGVGSYVCALHGSLFSDETIEGPPLRSARGNEEVGDRAHLIEAAEDIARQYGTRFDLQPSAVESAIERLRAVEKPIDFAGVELAGSQLDLPNSARGIATAFGRALLLDERLPPWRAALYAQTRDPESDRLGRLFRFRHTELAAEALNAEQREAIEQITSSTRATIIKGLRRLGRIGGQDVRGEVEALVDHAHRGVAAVARQSLKQITWTDFDQRIKAFAENKKQPADRRARAYRVLAEYYPEQIREDIALLRVDPDARIQRAVIPCLVDDADGSAPLLASLLAANPWSDQPRPGLSELRLEIIEYLSGVSDARAIPALLGAIRDSSRLPPAEALALSRALVRHPDPRARGVLTEQGPGFDASNQS